MNKKAQASTLILLIMIVLVFYILFLPSGEREKLLGENESTITDTTTSSAEKIVLLSTDIGSLSYTKEKEIEHSLTPVLLEERANAAVLSEISPFSVRKGWFTSKTKRIAFSIEKPELTEKAFLNFQLTKHTGSLRAKLNDVEIFNNEVTSDAPLVVELKKELLQKVNTLEFEVYGFGFFAREYSFKDVKIVGDIVDISKHSALQTFIVSPDEKNNLASGHLSFYAVCNKEKVGTLTISLNARVLTTNVPNCNSINRFETTSTDFYEGRNELEFKLDSGKARLDSVVVKTKLKPTKSYIDYFNINSTLVRKIDAGQRKAWLRVEFIDDTKQKTADININGVLSTIDQSTPKYEKDITSKVREGNNYLALTPRTELNVVKLEISAE